MDVFLSLERANKISRLPWAWLRPFTFLSLTRLLIIIRWQLTNLFMWCCTRDHIFLTGEFSVKQLLIHFSFLVLMTHISYRIYRKEEGIVFKMTVLTMQSIVILIHSPFKPVWLQHCNPGRAWFGVSVFSVCWRAWYVLCHCFTFTPSPLLLGFLFAIRITCETVACLFINVAYLIYYTVRFQNV